jgi:hypothetical protein
MVTPKKQKRPKVRMPVWKFSPLVRTILLAAIPVILAVTVLVFVFGDGTNEPSPTAPTTTPAPTLPSVIIVRPTDGTEQPTEVLVPPDTQPSEPTESTPPYTPPTEPSTEPPTEPPVTLPEGTPVSNEELAHLQDLFHSYSVYASMSRYSFTDPTTMSLQALTAVDLRLDAYRPLSEQEKYYLAGIAETYLYLDVCVISRNEIESILQQYYGLTLEDFYPIKGAVYFPQTDCFYFFADTYFQNLGVTHAVTLPGGNIWVRYIEKNHGDVGTMILSSTGEYHILSNIFANPIN